MQERHEILILGPEAAGKTQLFNRLLKKEFNSKYEGTVGIDSQKNIIPNKRTIVYRDVGSDSNVITFEKLFYSSHQIYLVFNAHDDNGLETLKTYIENFEFPDTAKITLIGTHADKGITTITENAAKVYALELEGEYYAISSKENTNIQALHLKSTELPTPILQPKTTRWASVDGSSFRDGASVVGLSSVALDQHERHLRTQDTSRPRFKIVNDRRSTKTLSTHNLSESQERMSDYNPKYPSVREESNIRSYHSVNGNSAHVTTETKAIIPFPQINSESRNNPITQRSPYRSPYRSPHRRNGNTPAHTQSSTSNPIPTPAPANKYSFAFRMAGIAMILAAVIGLIYTALVIVNILTATALISLMNHIVVGMGSLLGASTSTNLVTLAASLNVSKTTVAAMLITGPNVALLALGFGVFRAGHKPVANTQNTHPSNFPSFTS